jgi:hypothetical protein
MGRAKVFYLDEYRKARQYKSLLEMIEGHLAEAGLLGKYSAGCCISSHGSGEFLKVCDGDDSGKCSE